ncbi:MAG: putative nicotinate-nucleotide adenylyltransferase [Pseudomonadota bacterium]
MTDRHSVRPRIGLLGGTFNPIHVGHLALARAARVALQLDAVRLIPTGQPWQKGPGITPATHRLAMTQLAARAEPWLSVDNREVLRSGLTYTVDTLAELRAQEGGAAALILLLGSDQLRNLATWYRYERLLELAHIAVTQRGLFSLTDLPSAVEALMQRHGRDALPDEPCGSIVFFRMPAVPVSATVLRQQLAAGERPLELLPDGVLDYIDRHGLYRVQAPSD